jgi:autotransporter-associated beta strand protein
MTAQMISPKTPGSSKRPRGFAALNIRRDSPLLAAALFLCGLPQQALATTYSWTVNGSSNWSDTTKWPSTGVPVSDLNTVITFSGTTQNTTATNDLGTVQLNSLSASNNASKSLNIAGNSLDFVKNDSNVMPTLLLAKNGGGSLSISVPFTVTDALTITNSGTNSGVTTISGAITNTGGMTFDGTGAIPIALSGVVSGAGGITAGGSYTITLSKANSYTGTTKVSGGTLALGIANAVSSSSNVVLSGGILRSDFSQTLGTLNLSASSTLDLSTAGTFAFANSSSLAGSWTGTLSIVGTFTDGSSVYFGVGGLTSGQLSQITINGSAASLDGSGYLAIAAIPEPSTYTAILGVFILTGAASKRRRVG